MLSPYYNYDNPWGIVVFAVDFLEGRTVKGTFESIEYLTKKRVYFSRKKKKKFDSRAFIRPREEYSSTEPYNNQEVVLENELTTEDNEQPKAKRLVKTK